MPGEVWPWSHVRRRCVGASIHVFRTREAAGAGQAPGVICDAPLGLLLATSARRNGDGAADSAVATGHLALIGLVEEAVARLAL